MPKLEVQIGNIKMKNPLMAASGTIGYGDEYISLLDLGKFGAIVLKGITLKPRLGNPPPRIAETPAGMLNSIGLQNIGLKTLIEDKIPKLRAINTQIIINICGERMDEYVELAKALDGVDGVSGLEVNVSCPNVERGGLEFGREAKMLIRLIGRIRKSTRLLLIVKLSPNVSDIKELALASQDEGADCISLINTILGMAVDIEEKKPRLANITGGLSGPAIRPIALKMVWEVAQVVKVPVIGMGGIISSDDALEFLLAGAKAVGIGTANFINPKAADEIVSGITDYLEENGIEDVNKLREWGRKWRKGSSLP